LPGSAALGNGSDARFDAIELRRHKGRAKREAGPTS